MHVIVRHGTHHLRRHVREVWQRRGAGFYGFAGTLMFLYLETMSLVGDVTGLPSIQLSVSGIVGWFVQNLVTGILNIVWASIWPVAWIQRFGVNLASAALLVGAYLVFLLIRPVVLRLLRDPDEPAWTPSDKS